MTVTQIAQEQNYEFSTGKLSRVLNGIARRFPHWIVRYNKARLLRSQMLDFEKRPRPEIKITIADKSHIDDISRVSEISRKRLEKLLDSGLTCFLAGIGDDPPASVAWNAFGKCFIRGMGLQYDFGKDAYGFWSATLPESRGLGLHYALMVAKAAYAKERGARYLYSMIEFDNELSYNIRMKTGYVPIADMYYFKIFNINFLWIKDLVTGRTEFKGFYGQARKGYKII